VEGLFVYMLGQDENLGSKRRLYSVKPK